MKRRVNIVWTLSTVVFFVSAFSQLGLAAKVTLKDGTVIEGKIMEKTGTYLKLEVKGVPVPYFLDEIDKVEEDVSVFPESPVSPPQKTEPKNTSLEKEYVDSDYGFSISFPEQWVAFQIPSQNPKVERVINAKREGDEIIPRLKLGISRSRKAEDILNKVAQIEEKSKEAGGSIILVSPPEDIVIGDLNVKRWVLDFQKFPASEGAGFSGKRLPSGVAGFEDKVKSESYLFVKNDVTVVLELIAHNDERFNAEREEALESLKSFRFLE